MVVRSHIASELYSLCYTIVNKAAFTLHDFMTNSDFVTISFFDVLTIFLFILFYLLRVTLIQCVHFTLHLVTQSKSTVASTV